MLNIVVLIVVQVFTAAALLGMQHLVITKKLSRGSHGNFFLGVLVASELVCFFWWIAGLLSLNQYQVCVIVPLVTLVVFLYRNKYHLLAE